MNRVELGFIEAEKITRHFAKTFYLASFFLPKDKRMASYSVYAICRLSDESVDGNSKEPRQDRIEDIKTKIDEAYGFSPLKENLLSAFRYTVGKYRIPKEYFYELIEGMRMDLSKSRYNNKNELSLYCYRVAGVVGLIMLHIFGYNDKAKNYAVQLGEAMQMTNILRDIKEDFKRGRIYLPSDELSNFGLTEKDIKVLSVSEAFKSFMRVEISRLKKAYQDSLRGACFIKCRRSRFVIFAMAEMYAGILKEIENNDYDVFSKRISVSNAGKLKIIIWTLLKGDYLCGSN